jgi:hypothetical protein
MIQSDIYKLLSENAGITSLVSTRIYPIELPQGGAVPAIVYTTNIVPVKSLDGESGLDNCFVEIVCWAENYLKAHLVAEAVRTAFESSGLGAMTDDMQDKRDEETRNYGVVMNTTVWSE